MTYLKYFLALTFSIYGSLVSSAREINCEDMKHHVDSLIKNINKENFSTYISDIEKVFEKHESCFKSYEIPDIYMELAEKTFDFTQDGDLTYCLKKKAILKGYDFFMILEDAPAIYLKDSYPLQYQELEHLTDSMFLVNNKNINVELAFVLRSMVRRDQEVRQREWIASDNKDTLRSDSLFVEMGEADKINELLLGDIFESYGYPGYSLVGSEHNACSLIMHHMSTDFQVKYIHLLDEAVQNKELFENLNFLIDKILYKKYKVTLYGTHWSNRVPESDPEAIKKYRLLLNLSVD